MGRGVIIALVVSLALNVFAVGFLSGRIVTKPADAPGASRMAGQSREHPGRFMRYARDLSPEARETFRAALRENLPDMRARHGEVRRLKRAFFETMRADPWDRAAIEAARKELEEAMAVNRALANEAFIESVEVLSPEERAKLLTHRPRGRRGDHHRGKRRFDEGDHRGPDRGDREERERPPPPDDF
ncbi:MAG: periplasmic heavy metal sensor [Pseudomonadota bacterium]